MSCSESDAIVARVEGEIAFVRLAQPLSSCGRCNEQGGCGKSALLGGDEARLIPIANEMGAHVGDTIVLSVPSGAVLRAAVWAYLMPSLLAILGAIVGTLVVEQDSRGAVIGTLIGLALGLWVLRRLPRRKTVLSARIK
jgi:sigma-E factor negative regulatory protein RseC